MREPEAGEDGTGHYPDLKAPLTIVGEHQRETAFLRHLILYDAGYERRELEQSIAQVQRDEHCVQRVVWMIVPFPMVALAMIAYGAILHQNFPYNGAEVVFRVLCEVLLASLICLVALAGLLIHYRQKLNRLREECRQLITRLLRSNLGKPPIPKLPGNQRESDQREAFQGAVKSAVLPTESLASSICAPEL